MSSLKEKIKSLEKEEIILALMECDGVQARAARKLGITERMIGYKIRKYNIEIKEVGKESSQQSVNKKTKPILLLRRRQRFS